MWDTHFFFSMPQLFLFVPLKLSWMAVISDFPAVPSTPSFALWVQLFTIGTAFIALLFYFISGEQLCVQFFFLLFQPVLDTAPKRLGESQLPWLETQLPFYL